MRKIVVEMLRIVCFIAWICLINLITWIIFSGEVLPPDQFITGQMVTGTRFISALISIGVLAMIVVIKAFPEQDIKQQRALYILKNRAKEPAAQRQKLTLQGVLVMMTIFIAVEAVIGLFAADLRIVLARMHLSDDLLAWIIVLRGVLSGACLAIIVQHDAKHVKTPTESE